MSQYNESLSASTRFLQASGAFAVKVNRGARTYEKGFKPSDNSQAISAQLVSDLNSYNEETQMPFNLAAQFHGEVVSIDVDTKNYRQMVHALMLFLPQCNYVWGRRKRPATHFAFNIKSAFDRNLFPVLTQFKTMDGVNLELKGGNAASGHCSMLPPSFIDASNDDQEGEGDEYIWHNIDNTMLTPIRVDIVEIINAMRLASVAALMSDYWHEGVRQELTMALAGGCHRAAALSTGVNEKLFHLTLDDVLQLVDVIGIISGDDRKDQGSRQQAVKSTWYKANQGLPTTGFTRIAELTSDKTIVQKLYTLVSDSGEIEELIDFTSRFVIKRGHALVYDTLPDVEGQRKLFMTKNQFALSYADRYVTFKNKRVLLPNLLWKLPNAQRVDIITVDPNKERLFFQNDNLGTYNFWQGFSAEYLPKPPALDRKPDIVKRFEDYVLDVLANGDLDRFLWILCWICDIFQNPDKKPGTALVLVGAQGVGKTFLGENILKRIIGGAHYGVTNSLQNVTRNFNAMFASKILVQCDEATRSTQRSIASKMNSLITDQQMAVEPKGVDPFMMPSLARFFITSNYITTAVSVDSAGDRRYTIIEVPSKRKGDLDFWESFLALLEDNTNIRYLYDYLCSTEVERRRIRLPLETNIRYKTIQASWGVFDKWLASMVERDHPFTIDGHKFPYYAQDWECKTIKDINDNIDRSEWPELIYFEGLLDDLHQFMRMHKKTSDIDGISSVKLLRFQLKKCGINTDGYGIKRVTVDMYDEKRKRNIKDRVYLSSCFSRQEVVEYLNKQYGWKPPDIDDDDE